MLIQLYVTFEFIPTRKQENNMPIEKLHAYIIKACAVKLVWMNCYMMKLHEQTFQYCLHSSCSCQCRNFLKHKRWNRIIMLQLFWTVNACLKILFEMISVQTLNSAPLYFVQSLSKTEQSYCPIFGMGY